jgi:hypothetical protein
MALVVTGNLQLTHPIAAPRVRKEPSPLRCTSDHERSEIKIPSKSIFVLRLCFVSDLTGRRQRGLGGRTALARQQRRAAPILAIYYQPMPDYKAGDLITIGVLEVTPNGNIRADGQQFTVLFPRGPFPLPVQQQVKEAEERCKELLKGLKPKRYSVP